MNKEQIPSPHISIHDNIAILSLGSSSERAIILNHERVSALSSILTDLSYNINKNDPNNKPLTGLIITSPATVNFCVGADINVIKNVSDPEQGAKLASEGQAIFQKIENLPIPVIAAIHGHCVGGGCELALACDYRIMTDHPSSKIGLPETKLGILPGFGGTQRLPALIGLPRALDIILSGKVVPAKKAKSIGLIDAVIPFNEDISKALIEKAKTFISLGKRNSVTSNKKKSGGTLSIVDRFLTYTKVGRYLCEKQARKDSFKTTKGKYPAIPKAITSCLNSFRMPKEAAYRREAEYLGELITTPESKALVHIYFLTENVSKLGKQETETSISSLALIGAGIMGKGIAAVSTKAGIKVRIFDLAKTAREGLLSHVKSYLSKSRSVSELERESLLSNLTLLEKVEDIPSSDLYIEAAVENLEVKKNLFNELAKNAHTESILASNTSSLSLKDIFENIPHPERTIGVHFFNPVEKMPLVELIRTKDTSNKTLIRSASFVSRLGKYPVVAEDVPGFLVNRILSPFLAEAAALIKEGAGFMQVEKASVNFGFPMGPFRLLDEVGLDVAYKVEEILTTAYGERMKGGNFLAQMNQRKLTGKKGGEGFYIFEGKSFNPNSNLLGELQINLTGNKISIDEIITRLTLSMINEAVRSFDEGVAGIPSREAAEQIDLASIMGFGFPPFRGGILYYARAAGFENILKSLKKLEHKGPRFIPADSLKMKFLKGYEQ
ncbi:MAG TPA: 3-hydroxyacyl-CoA dehydrogenase NAD-binding domain-containing protein [Oligoflexia bacterium]|nr:3-hydroxyacyl-CoA dehydrogenase NAD-binding domain-containing protein [Oligoflexia bacterium]HMP47204.1 3-hydroxyacyl-CoA dehydrogenase NAD-binding domain-containing protein [Oligoflexia bacterium]